MDSTSRIRPEQKNIEKLSVFPGLVGRLGSDAIYAGVGEIHAEPGGKPREKDRFLINPSGTRYDSRCFFSILAFPFQSTSNRPSLDPIRMMHAFLEEYID